MVFAACMPAALPLKSVFVLQGSLPSEVGGTKRNKGAFEIKKSCKVQSSSEQKDISHEPSNLLSTILAQKCCLPQKARPNGRVPFQWGLPPSLRSDVSCSEEANWRNEHVLDRNPKAERASVHNTLKNPWGANPYFHVMLQASSVS